MENEKIEAIKLFWNSMNSNNISFLEEIYSTDIQFEDPISKGKGIEELKEHFRKIFSGFSDYAYVYGRSVQAGEYIVIEWTLKATFSSNRGIIELPGVSWLEVNKETGRISASKEYYDLGKVLYEKIPFLGYIIRRIKVKVRN